MSSIRYTTTDLDFPTAQRPGNEAVTLIAELALADHWVHKLPRADFLVCKWGYSYYAQDFHELRAFEQKLGVSHEF